MVAEAAPGPAPRDVAAAWCTAFFDELVRAGVGHAVVCPGSRSTPLALAAVAHPGLTVHVRLDERSAAFSALGMGLATGSPAAVVVTSGTAAAELHAAVVEADLARIPLVVVTADRPPELHDAGAPQTIDQDRLFGAAVRWFHDPGVPSSGTRPTWRSLASRVAAAALGGGTGSRGPGPVHVNVPFREPLIGRAEEGGVPSGRPDGAPWHRVVRAGPAAPAAGPDGRARALDRRRGLLVVGALGSDAAPLTGGPASAVGALTALTELAARRGWPILAEPRSGLADAAGEPVGAALVTAAELVLRSERFVAAHRPDVIVRIGPPWASKVVNGFVAGAARGGVPLVVIDPWDRWTDPDGVVDTVVRSDVVGWCRGELATGPGDTPAADPGWAAAWRAADESVRAVLDGRFGPPTVTLSEPALARRLTAALPDDALLVVASSMPVRDVETFADRTRPHAVVANRGANGIDGVVSTALGAALASGRPTVALVGDLAFLHDSTALVAVSGVEIPLTVVVADNGGGGIFSFLDQATTLPTATFEQLFGTPPGTDVAAVARGFGCVVDEIGATDGPARLEDVLHRHLAERRVSVVRVRVPDRSTNVELHRELAAAAVRAVEAGPG